MSTQPSAQQHPGTEILYTVGEAADLVGASIPTIRMYEREGLIITSRRLSRHRRYTAADIERIRCIRTMIREHKVSIAGIRRLLALNPLLENQELPGRGASFLQRVSAE